MTFSHYNSVADVRTFCCLQPDQFTVLSLSCAVESLHTGVVHGVEVETVHGANRLFATVNLLQITPYAYSDRNKALVTINNLQTTTSDS